MALRLRYSEKGKNITENKYYDKTNSRIHGAFLQIGNRAQKRHFILKINWMLVFFSYALLSVDKQHPI